MKAYRTRRPWVVFWFLMIAIWGRDVRAEGNLGNALNLIPTPQYLEPLNMEIALSGSKPVRIVTGPKPDPKIALAARLLKDDLERREPRLRGKVNIADADQENNMLIY